MFEEERYSSAGIFSCPQSTFYYKCTSFACTRYHQGIVLKYHFLIYLWKVQIDEKSVCVCIYIDMCKKNPGIMLNS